MERAAEHSREPGLDELRAAVASHDVCVPAVSQWSVGRHVHHLCLSMKGICRALGRATTPPPRPLPSVMGTVLLLIGRIPRGRARAIEAVSPSADASPEQLHALLDESERALAGVRTLDRSAWFRHFELGVMKRDQALRFMCIHNRHHLRIIADIRAAASRSPASDRVG